MVRFLAAILVLATLAACSPSGKDLDEPPVPLGKFRLGHNVVVTPKTQKVPLGRELPNEQLAEALRNAVGARFSRYDGDGLYHLGISIESYLLAPPGVPIVASPKSLMLIRVTVWDDAAGKKLNEKPEQMVIAESVSGETLLSSGLTQSAEKQLDNLVVNAAKQIEVFLERKNEEEGWFGGPDAVAPDADATEADETDDADDAVDVPETDVTEEDTPAEPVQEPVATTG